MFRWVCVQMCEEKREWGEKERTMRESLVVDFKKQFSKKL